MVYKCQDKYVHFRLFEIVQFGLKNRYQLCLFYDYCTSDLSSSWRWVRGKEF